MNHYDIYSYYHVIIITIIITIVIKAPKGETKQPHTNGILR